jgi:protein-S-isoprenylcysteine O-methyltransferase Ste14
VGGLLVGFFLFWVFLIMFIIFFVILYWKLLVLSKKEEKYLKFREFKRENIRKGI